MGRFDYNSFVDLSHIFDAKKGQVVVRERVPTVHVTLFAPRKVVAGLPQSKFIDFKSLVPTIKDGFVSIALKKKAPHIESKVLQRAFEAPAAVTIAPVAAVPEKKRTTLKLKTNVELPALPATVSRNSKAIDIVAAFRAEKVMLQKRLQNGQAEKFVPAGMPIERRQPHPLSHKSWAELIAEAEAPKQTRSNFDLAAAFKAEMKAFMAEQEREKAALAAATPAVPAQPLTSSFSRPKIATVQPRNLLARTLIDTPRRRMSV